MNGVCISHCFIRLVHCVRAISSLSFTQTPMGPGEVCVTVGGVCEQQGCGRAEEVMRQPWKGACRCYGNRLVSAHFSPSIPPSRDLIKLIQLPWILDRLRAHHHMLNAGPQMNHQCEMEHPLSAFKLVGTVTYDYTLCPCTGWYLKWYNILLYITVCVL